MFKILFVEDDQMIVEIYKRKFEDDGFEFVNAKSGKEVLRYASSEKFDLILLDMVLPEIGGMEVLKELRSNPAYDKNLKVIIFSNLGEEETRRETMENGANGFIGKTQYNPSELVSEIKRILNEYVEQEKNKEKVIEKKEETSNKKKILLIEDEEIFLDMFGKKLVDDGYEVTRANNGAWGVKEALEGSYDLIITDMVMPAMSGEEIISKIKQEEKTKNIPVVVISASVDIETEKAVRELGVSEFFLKTRIVPSDLSRKVSEILRKNK